METDINNPTLYEVSQLSRDYGLVGERDTHLVVFLSFFGGGFVVMTGLSSGGKDEVVDAAEYCVPDNFVYKIPTSLSKTALYERADDINSHPVHRHKDISSLKDKGFLEDIWKSHGDGRSITHSWTEVVPERHEESQTILPPNCMILFLAEDNKQVSLNDYPEVRNRALVVSIDDSSDLTERVNERQADQEAGLIDYKLTEERTEEIHDYVAEIPMHTYGDDDGNGSFLNPVAPAIDNQNPLPQHFTEARRDFPRLMDFMSSVALFHFDERMEVAKKNLPDFRDTDMLTMLVTPKDAWLAMRIFGEKMVLSALNLREKDFELLRLLRQRNGEAMTAAELQMEMRDSGYNITSHDVRSAMDNMLTKGYIRKDQNSTPVVYSAAPFASSVSREVRLDWSQVIEDTRETVYESLPDDIASTYEDRFLSGAGLLVTHPFTGETVNLEDHNANELEEKVEEQEQEEEEAFDEDVFGGGDSTQGQLG